MTQQNPLISSTAQECKEVLKKISRNRIYFGHQSVGLNILDGLQDILKEYPSVKLSIIELENPKQFAEGAIVHSRIGKNRDPFSKLDAFVRILNGGVGNSVDVVFIKFCYVDFDGATDVQPVFNGYRETVKSLREKFPKLKFIHVTVPLKINKAGIKAKIKKIIGKTDIWEYTGNIKRNQFNEMLIKEYSASEPVFDLAKVESTCPNGKRVCFELGGKTYFSLAPEYTTDGGHLNEPGRRRVAGELIKTLARLIPTH